MSVRHRSGQRTERWAVSGRAAPNSVFGAGQDEQDPSLGPLPATPSRKTRALSASINCPAALGQGNGICQPPGSSAIHRRRGSARVAHRRRRSRAWLPSNSVGCAF